MSNPWETALSALGAFETRVRDYDYPVAGMRDTRLQEIADAKRWVRAQKPITE